MQETEGSSTRLTQRKLIRCPTNKLEISCWDSVSLKAHKLLWRLVAEGSTMVARYGTRTRCGTRTWYVWYGEGCRTGTVHVQILKCFTLTPTTSSTRFGALELSFAGLWTSLLAVWSATPKSLSMCVQEAVWRQILKYRTSEDHL